MFNFQNRQITTLVIGILCAIKIILQAFGVNVITNTEINQIADGVAALCTVIAVFMTHMKKPQMQARNTADSGSSGRGLGVPAESLNNVAEISHSTNSATETEGTEPETLAPQAASDGEAKPM